MLRWCTIGDEKSCEGDRRLRRKQGAGAEVAARPKGRWPMRAPQPVRVRRLLRRAKRVQWTLFRAREIYFLRTTNVNSDSDVCTKEGETIYSIGSPFFHLKCRNYFTYEDKSAFLSLLLLLMES